MPEMTFGRSIRYRRTKLGLSQTRLGELVGRSGAAVRSWEKDASTPTDPSVLQALSAVLGIDEETLFEKAGVSTPEVEDSPTVEQALGTLAPGISSNGANEIEEDQLSELRSGFAQPLHEPKPVTVGVAASPISEASSAVSTAPDARPQALVYSAPAPPVVEPSYIEDQSQRQLYRVRNLGTLVLVVALVVLFVWALGNGWESFTNWWDGFISTLQL